MDSYAIHLLVLVSLNLFLSKRTLQCSKTVHCVVLDVFQYMFLGVHIFGGKVMNIVPFSGGKYDIFTAEEEMVCSCCRTKGGLFWPLFFSENNLMLEWNKVCLYYICVSLVLL